ncbi:MAG: hypothetical protein KME47_10070 [Nodosilinea sp. WJT8-NPBG4]|jgi:hypothetical protein|nr:hypothetical protein [Nodosilinea sp. WJT8-NPBG4]
MSNFGKPISDIQRAYLSRATDYVKNTVYGGIGYGKLGKELTGTGADLNPTTLMRWFKASDAIGKPAEELEGFVKVVPNQANLKVLALALPEAADEEKENIETIYLSTLEKSGIDTEDYTESSELEPELSRKAGYALPINRDMFAYVFGLSLADSRRFPDQITHLVERVADLEDFQLQTESDVKDLRTNVSGLREAFNTFQEKVSSELAGIYTSGNVEVTSGISPDILNRIQTLEDSLARQHLQNNLNGSVDSGGSSDLGNVLSSLMSTQNALFGRLLEALTSTKQIEVPASKVEELYIMVDPLESVRRVITESGKTLAEIAEFSGIPLEDVETLLSGGFDSIYSDPTLPIKTRYKADRTINALIEGLNVLCDSDLSREEVILAYTKAQSDESIKIHHPELQTA